MANLPARRAEPTGPTGTPLSQTPTEALTLALGYVLAKPIKAEAFGGFCALVEELQARGRFDFVMAFLPPDLVRSASLLYQAQRGQHWHHTGQRRQGRASDQRH